MNYTPCALGRNYEFANGRLTWTLSFSLFRLERGMQVSGEFHVPSA